MLFVFDDAESDRINCLQFDENFVLLCVKFAQLAQVSRISHRGGTVHREGLKQKSLVRAHCRRSRFSQFWLPICRSRHLSLLPLTQFFPSLRHLVLRECAGFTSLEKLRAVKVPEEFDQLRDDTGPARLVAGSEARAIVAVEIFIEQDVIFPLWIGLKFLRTSIHRPPARPVSQKDPS